eukprot:1151861-Pelagomonas_calceolata.AAC.1
MIPGLTSSHPDAILISTMPISFFLFFFFSFFFLLLTMYYAAGTALHTGPTRSPALDNPTN